ncbi:MAG: hypothetical protein KBS67_02255 [Bacteroidales bacterium]|nr:hypothetical protein [Candidatus Cryptobacteroides equifaecalis]
MSQQYSGVVYRTLIASSELDGRATISYSEATVTARVRASGFKLARLQMSGRKASTIAFNAEDMNFSDGDAYVIQASRLNRYMPAIFGEDVIVESVISDFLTFHFASQSFKKVPVMPVSSITYKKQYTSSEGVVIKPDSLLVYGETSLLENVNAIYTKPLNRHDVERSIHGNLKLEIPRNIRTQKDFVEYSVDVVRYVEMERTVRLDLRNAPAEVEYSILPSTVNVKFQCRFPGVGSVADEVNFFVDYKEFIHSKSGKCMVRADGVSDGIIRMNISPEVVDCFVEEKRK